MISNDRFNHIISVARLMKDECLKRQFPQQYIEEMFTLGYLHDIGYEFSEHADHNAVGAEFLQRQNYKYSSEIKYHGVPNCEYSSFELDLLNWADMHTDGKGNYVTFDERLADIANRRGSDSPAYINSKKIINSLIEKGFN